MIDFKIGDTVRLLMAHGKPKVKLLSFHGHGGFNFEYLENYIDWRVKGDTGWATFNKFERIEFDFTPGDRVRGYVEGVVSGDGRFINASGLRAAIDTLSDITVIKTLPTAPGSLVDLIFTDRYVRYVLDIYGMWLSLDGKFRKSHDEMSKRDDWTLKFDAGT